MKYNIEGVEKHQTIKDYKVEQNGESKVLTVDYLDNTSDFFKAKEEVITKVQSLMEEQAETYVNSGKDKKLESNKVGYTVSSVLFGITTGLCLPSVAGVMTTSAPVLVTGAMVVSLSALTASLIKRESIKKELDYIKKLKLFLDNKVMIESRYEQVRDAEKELGIDTEVKHININTVDNISTKKMTEVINKCERYQLIDETPFQKHL